MGKRLYVIVGIIIFETLISSTGFSFSLNFEFVDGQTLCADITKKLGTQEYAKWVSVPVDYNNPSGEKTLIYAYTKKPFDSTLPSLLYFVGGPGGTPRGNEFSLPHMNVINFEERGVICSRPQTRELFLNPKFYSSENDAKDGLSILNAFGVKQASIYGHSYGTLPATIFASKFPSRVTRLLLEGVVFKADESLWMPKKKTEILEKFFYALTPAQQKRIIDFTANPGVPKNWFSAIAMMSMAVGNFQEGLMSFLEFSLFKPSTDPADEEQWINLAKNLVPEADTTTPAETNYGNIALAMTACQEMNMADPMVSRFLNFENGHFVPDRNNVERDSMCVPLGLDRVQAPQYTAEKYPTQTPVTYFLGEIDPQTSLEQGLRHFNLAKSQHKQAFIFLGGGHVSNIEQVIQAGFCNPAKENCNRWKQEMIQLELFEKAAKGSDITDRDISRYNSAGKKQWAKP